MALETITWPGPPTLTDNIDGTQAYTMGLAFTVSSAIPCSGVQWRVPDSVSTPPGGTHAVALFQDSTGDRLAYKEFVPVVGGNQIINWDAIVNLAISTTYVVWVYTQHYVFRSGSPAGLTTPSGLATVVEGRLEGYNGGAATADNSNGVASSMFYVSPVVGTGTTPFSKSITESYRVLNSWTRTAPESYRVLAPWTKTAPEAYRVLGAWSKAVSDQYRVLNGWSLGVAESYRVFNGWTRSVAEQYAILGGVAFSLNVPESYRIFNTFSATQVESYRILAAFTATHAESYRILGAFSLVVGESYRVLGAWLRLFIERYTVGDVAPPLPRAATVTAYLSTSLQRADLVEPLFTVSLGHLITAHLDEES